MSDPIDRQAAIDATTDESIVRNMDSVYDSELHRCKRAMHRILASLPSVERKKGRWIEHEVKGFDGCHTGRFFDECSECGKLTPEWRKITEYHRWYYCPNCGADMRGEEE